jgi:NMD protein affecting ribosome stability and mRNA decay
MTLCRVCLKQIEDSESDSPVLGINDVCQRCGNKHIDERRELDIG